MTYLYSSDFRYINRNYSQTLVLIPGWATDFRIFNFLDTAYNYIIPLDFSPSAFKDQLLAYLKSKNIKRVSVLGFSLGGFVAGEFAFLHPEIIEKLILVGIRKRYKKHEIKQTLLHLKENKAGFLYRFYSLCVPQNDSDGFWRVLFKDYCRNLDLQYLIETLLYLDKREIKHEELKNIKKIKIIHGENDAVAPLHEVIEIGGSLKNAEVEIIRDTGHLPFLKKNLSVFYDL